jgi:hypothetical protein
MTKRKEAKGQTTIYTMQKTKDRATRTLLKTECELECSEMVSSSLMTKYDIEHEHPEKTGVGTMYSIQHYVIKGFAACPCFYRLSPVSTTS